VVNGLGTGGSDGSCVPGKRTFIIRNSNNCGIANSPALLTLNVTSTSGYDHLYTFGGALYQEGTQNNMLMTDSYGNSATILFTLTYRFLDSSDPNYDYGTCCGPEQQRPRLEVTPVPSSGTHVDTLVVP